MYRTLFPVLLDRCFGVVMRSPFEPSANHETPLDRFAGTFSWIDVALTVRVSDQGLTLSSGGDVVVKRVGDSTFVLDNDHPADSTLKFAEFDDQGRAQMLYRLVWPFPRTE